jgi:hypothetical protein
MAPPSPALVRSNSKGKGGRPPVDLPSVSNVAIINGRTAGTSSSQQPQPKRQSSGQPPQVGTPGIYPYTPGTPTYAGQGSDRYASGGDGTYDSRNGTNSSALDRLTDRQNAQSQQLGGQGNLLSPLAQNQMVNNNNNNNNNNSSSVDVRNPNGNSNGQQMTNGEYMDHEEDEPKKGGFSKFIEFITCRCA